MSRKGTFCMNKYIYVVGLFYSLLTFMVGWNHFLEFGGSWFGVAFMSMTPITVFILTLMWLRERDLKSAREESVDVDSDLL